MITAFKPSKPDRPRTHCLKQNKRVKNNIPCVNDENPKETSVLIAFQKPTAIWDIKMEDAPQLAVQDLKSTCSKKIKHQHSAHCNNRILHMACHLPHEWHTSDVCHLKP